MTNASASYGGVDTVGRRTTPTLGVVRCSCTPYASGEMLKSEWTRLVVGSPSEALRSTMETRDVLRARRSSASTSKTGLQPLQPVWHWPLEARSAALSGFTSLTVRVPP